jgi:transcriptional regulator with XRE-family HTH domain
MHTGKKIKLLRNIKNITQEELAEKINKTRALVSHIEKTGKVKINRMTHNLFEPTQLSGVEIFQIEEEEIVGEEESEDEI